MDKQSGQVGIVILLIMSVLLAMGLSLASRTTQDVEITSNQEEAARVFNAAESGVEQALQRIHEAERSGDSLEDTISGNLSVGDSTSQYEAAIQAQAEFEMNVPQNSAVEIKLDTSLNNVLIEWWYGQPVNCSTRDYAGLVVTVFDELASSTQAHHYFYSYCNSPTDFTKNFTQPSYRNDETGYQFYQPLDNSILTADSTIIRIMPVINGTRLKVSGDIGTESQYAVTSRAQDSNQQTAKTIIVDRSRSAAPTFMNFALVSGGTLRK